MRIGSLDQRITIESPTTVRGAMGGSTQTWSYKASRWASVKARAGTEGVQGEKIVATHTYQVRMRYYPELSTQDRIIHLGKTLQIQSISHASAKDELTEALCVETKD